MGNNFKLHHFLFLCFTQCILSQILTVEQVPLFTTTQPYMDPAKAPIKHSSRLASFSQSMKQMRPQQLNDESKQDGNDEVAHFMPPKIIKKFASLRITTIQEQQIQKAKPKTPKQNVSANTAPPNDIATLKDRSSLINYKSINRSRTDVAKPHILQTKKWKDQSNKVLDTNSNNSKDAYMGRAYWSNLKKKHHPAINQSNKHPQNKIPPQQKHNNKLQTFKNKWESLDPSKIEQNKLDLSCNNDKDCRIKFPEVQQLGAKVKCNLTSKQCYAS